MNQTFKDWECIIIDDGSTDNTEEIAESLVTQDPRIRYLRQENKGSSAARNLGLEAISGHYVQFLDADDFILPGKFEEQLALLSSQSGPAVVYCDYYWCDQEGRRRSDINKTPAIVDENNVLMELATKWQTEISIPCHCFLFDARLFNTPRIRFDETLANHVDWDCWMRIFGSGPPLLYVDQELAVYRWHESAMTRNPKRMHMGYLQAIRKQIEINDENEELKSALQQRYRQINRSYRVAKCRRFIKKVVPAWLTSSIKRRLHRSA